VIYILPKKYYSDHEISLKNNRSSCDHVERYDLIDLFKFSYIYDRSSPRLSFRRFWR